MALIQYYGKSRAIHYADISSVYMITFCLCVYALICVCGILFIFFPILLSMNCHSDYDTIDGRIAGNRRPYPDIFQRSIKSPRVLELCLTLFVVET